MACGADGVQRLKTRPQFQACLAAQVVSRSPHFALHRALLASSVDSTATAAVARRVPVNEPALFAVQDVWLGAMVPKRWARKAVTRNAIKRQIYSVGASFESQLPAAAHLVRLRAGFDRSRFVSASSDALKHAVRVELQQLFARCATLSPAALPAATEPAP